MHERLALLAVVEPHAMQSQRCLVCDQESDGLILVGDGWCLRLVSQPQLLVRISLARVDSLQIGAAHGDECLRRAEIVSWIDSLPFEGPDPLVCIHRGTRECGSR